MLFSLDYWKLNVCLREQTKAEDRKGEILMSDSEQFELEKDTEQEMDSLKAQILDAFSMGSANGEVQSLLDDYESRFGKDLFWKMMAFDLAEMARDVEEMKSLAVLMEDEPLGPVIHAVNIARIAYCQEDYQGAMQALNEVDSLEDNEESLVYLHLKGIVAFALKDYRLAAQCMEDVMLDVEDEQVAGITGICYLRLSDGKRAQEYLDRMIEQNHDEDYGWLYDLLVSFGEFDIVLNPLFPRSVRLLLELHYVTDAGLSLDQFEEAILSDPAAFLPALTQLSENMPAAILSCYFLAVAYDALGDEKNARKWFRKTLRLSIEHPESDEQSAPFLHLKLQSLERLNYSRQIQIRYLREFWDAPTTDSSGRIDLILYASIHEYHALLRDWVNSGSLPECETAEDIRKLHNALLYYYYQTNALCEAYDEACFLYENELLVDVMSILICAFLFRLFNYGGLRQNAKESDFTSLSGYVIDQLIEMEQLRLDDRADELKARLHQLYQERRSRTEPEWEFFDEFLKVFSTYLGYSESMIPVVLDAQEMLSGLQSR